MQATTIILHSLLTGTYMGFVKRPEIFLQLLLSPPQTPHLSNFLLEPSLPSQPALLHLPWTQTPEESGEHGVPSTTCERQEKRLQKAILTAETWQWIGHAPQEDNYYYDLVLLITFITVECQLLTVPKSVRTSILSQIIMTLKMEHAFYFNKLLIFLLI